MTKKTFYDEHPFDWVGPYTGAEIRSVISAPLVEEIESLPRSALALDVGCGAGRVLAFLVQRGIRSVGADLSRISVSIAARRYGVAGVVADTLHLPFRDGVADLVISDGVVHHTPDPRAAFAENCRLVKNGGRMYLSVYKPGGRYEFLYNYPGVLIRYGLQRRLTTPLVFLFAMLPYYLVHLVKSRGKRRWDGAKNLFYDYFASPHVNFISRHAVEGWCTYLGLKLIRYSENPRANVHSFVLERIAGKDQVKRS
jgi:SAM-dependent methyltransferase